MPSQAEGATPEIDLSASAAAGADASVHASRPIVRVEEPRLSAPPGGTARTTVTIRNVGSVVETYSVSVIGDAAAWIAVATQEVSLFPGDEMPVTLTLRPPRQSSVPAGDYTVGVVGRSVIDPTVLTVAEFIVTVLPFYAFMANPIRPSMEMRRSAVTYLKVENTGNAPLRLQFDATDPEGYLRTTIGERFLNPLPSDIHWVELRFRGKLLWFGSPKTRNLAVTTTPLNELLDPVLARDVAPAVNRLAIIQRPLMRLRLGFLGRILLILGLLAIVATFLISRLSSPDKPPIGSPEPPTALISRVEGSSIVLNWAPSGGTSGYVVYEDAASAKRYADGGKPVGDEALPTPICNDCTQAGQVAAGVTRYVVSSPTPGQLQCYRLVATAGDSRSLFTAPTCGTVPKPSAKQAAQAAGAAAAAAAAASAAAAAAASAAKPPPCAPVITAVKPSGQGALALVWKLPTQLPAGATEKTCTLKATLTGFQVQQQILKGWADLVPQPGPNDSAKLVSGLQPATKYCFWIRSTTAINNSSYSRKVCAKTLKAPATPTPSPASTP